MAKTNVIKALIVDTPYIDQILNGEKVWDLRSTHCSIRGKIALIRKGSGTIVGTIEIVDSIGPLSNEEVIASQNKHHLTSKDFQDPKKSKWRYAWVLKNYKKFTKPVAYSHPKGAVIWVNLDFDLIPRP